MNTTINHSAVETNMNENTRAIAESLDSAGYMALWAKGKGGGFWIQGMGYLSPSKCRKLIVNSGKLS
jgi:hypothetical protein